MCSAPIHLTFLEKSIGQFCVELCDSYTAFIHSSLVTAWSGGFDADSNCYSVATVVIAALETFVQHS